MFVVDLLMPEPADQVCQVLSPVSGSSVPFVWLAWSCGASAGNVWQTSVSNHDQLLIQVKPYLGHS